MIRKTSRAPWGAIATLLCAACTAAAADTRTPALPSWLTSHVTDGELSWSDLSWTDRRFSTDAASHAQWAEAMAWVAARKRERTSELKRALKEAGAAADSLEDDCYDDDVCFLIESLDALAKKVSGWDTFQSAVREARPYVDGYRYAIQTVAQVAEVDNPKLPLAQRLEALRTVDQGYRIGVVGDARAHLPPFSDSARQLFAFALWIDIRKNDRATTAVVHDIVDKSGWPTRTAVGEKAQENLWLLVQHADQDPVLQFRTLQLMEPLIAKGEASPKMYGYLYDRVMLKLAGKQRYGTQMHCEGGKMAPLPLEDPSKLDVFRKQAGMPPMADYEKLFADNRC